MYRCQWAGSNENMQIYHDTTWGVPEYDDQRLFEISFRYEPSGTELADHFK